MAEQVDVAVIGGGVAGLSAAWFLAEAGREVTVLEAGAAGRGVSWDAAGMLAPLHELAYTELDLLHLGLYSRELYADWEAVLGAEQIGLVRRGALEVGLSPDDRPELERRYAFMQQQGLKPQWLEGNDLQKLEPALAQRITTGIFAPEDAQVDNRALVLALAENLRTRGIRFLEQHTVTSLTETNNILKVSGNQTGQEHTFELNAQQVVVANGLGVADVLVQNLLTSPHKLYPIKGQMASLEPLPAYTLPQTVVRIRSRVLGDGYVVPKANRLVVGATAEEKGRDRNVTAGGLLDILRRAYAAVPGLYELPIQETWAGLRPSTLDRQPFLLGSLRHKVLHLNGLYRHGILLAPALGQAAAQWAQGSPILQQVRPFYHPA